MASTFALDVAAFAKKAGTNAQTVVRKVSIDVLTKTVLRTPVGNPSLWKGKPPAGYVGGRARANWNVSFSSPDTSTSTQTDKTGLSTIGQGSAQIQRADGERDIYIMNSLPYIRRLEYDGHSSQAPAGMVRITVGEFQAFINDAVRGLP